MTERRRRPGPFPVFGTAIATFLAVLVLLAVQLQGGHDPVLGTVPIASLSAGQHGPKVVTRSSGGGPAAQQPSGGATSKAVTTRASGAAGEWRMTRRVAAVPVAWVAGVAFLALFAALALQLRHGRDPVLGAELAAPVAVAPRRVLLRRLVVRRVIVRVIPAASAPAPSAPVTAGAPPTAVTPATTSAPVVTSSPAPAPAPAPAAPPTTRCS